MIDPGLSGKVVLVTGANNPYGIGAATARAFAAQGARVFVTYFRQAPETFGMSEREAEAVQEPGEAFYNAQQRHSATELVQQIREQGAQAEAWEADLANPAIVPQLFQRAEEAFGPVEVLINNAAVGGAPKDTFMPTDQPRHDHFQRIVHTITAESHDRHFAVNSRAVALLMAEFARRHTARGAT
jgi:3-oxoacyl-[acyl-carrier protein] reductase